MSIDARPAAALAAVPDSAHSFPAKSRAAPTDALLLSADASAALCGVSEASWWRYQSAGKVPAPLKLGGRTLWRRPDLELWIELGCPDRAVFEVERKARNGNGRPRQASR